MGRPEDEFLDLNEAEEILRQLRKDNPAEYERIANLRDGIRTARPSLQRGLYVFCQAGRFQQLFLLDEKGEVVSRDVPKVVGAVKCAPDAKAAPLPDGYNKTVMAIQRTVRGGCPAPRGRAEHTRQPDPRSALRFAGTANPV